MLMGSAAGDSAAVISLPGEVSAGDDKVEFRPGTREPALGQHCQRTLRVRTILRRQTIACTSRRSRARATVHDGVSEQRTPTDERASQVLCERAPSLVRFRLLGSLSLTLSHTLSHDTCNGCAQPVFC